MRFTSETVMLLAFAIHLEEEVERKRFVHSRYEKRFYRQLSKLQRELRHRRIPRCALLSPGGSAWKKVYQSHSDQALITMTGLDFRTFHFILNKFKTFYDDLYPNSNDWLIGALDSNIALMGNIYSKLETVYNLTGAKCTVDSAFSRNNYPFLIKSCKPSLDMTIDEMEIAKDATSMRQSSEWGMHAFQASFPRIKDRITLEERGQRKLMIKLMIYLYNLRTRRVGINQILNVYMPSLNEDVNALYIH